MATYKYNTNTMKGGLDYEKSRFPMANQFLNQLFPFRTIERVPWSTPSGRDYQKSDVDVVLMSPGEDVILISEKFRSDYYNDLMIEIYSDKDNRKPGWGIISYSDYMHYWMRRKPTIVSMQPLKNLIVRIKAEFNSDIEEMIETGMHRLDTEFEGFPISFICNPTYGSNKEILWQNLTVTISFDILKYFNIDYERYEVDKQSTKDNLKWNKI